MKIAKTKLKNSGFIAPVMEVPMEANLPHRNGYMISYTHDGEIAVKVVSQLKYLCGAHNIPTNSKFHGGAAVKLKLEKTYFSGVSQVACVDVLCQIYRNL